MILKKSLRKEYSRLARKLLGPPPANLRKEVKEVLNKLTAQELRAGIKEMKALLSI